MGSSLFGSSSSTTERPEYEQRAHEYSLNRAIDLGQVGYMPYAGAQVAAFDPAQVSAMENNSAAAGAFGLSNDMPRISNATDYGNGTWGYSSMPLYNQQMEWMQQNQPGQLDYYNSFFIDPVTGQLGTRMADAGMREANARGEQGFYADYGGAADHGYGGMDGRAEGGQSGFAGYSGLGDMTDGGGPGQSGNEFGGLFGGVSNAAGASPSGSGGGFFGGLFG